MSAKKEKPKTTNVVNRKARFEYEIIKKFEAGIQLQGSEVKSCREGKIQLLDSYASIERDELYLYKAHIAEFKQAGPYFNHPPTRKRKLLMHKSEILKLNHELKTSGMTLVPLRVFFVRGYAKIELGLAKGKSNYDKRQSIKKKEENRKISQALKRGD